MNNALSTFTTAPPDTDPETTRIAIIVGSTRPGRKARAVAEWVWGQAAARDDASFEILDIADFELPLLDEPDPPMMGQSDRQHTRAWASAVGSHDGFVFVTPEYNHSTSGALKNAIDFVFAEWNDKACGFVGYGVDGGPRAIEHLRQIAAEVKLADVRTHVGLNAFSDVVDGQVECAAASRDKLDIMLGEVVAWSNALRHLRTRA